MSVLFDSTPDTVIVPGVGLEEVGVHVVLGSNRIARTLLTASSAIPVMVMDADVEFVRSVTGENPLAEAKIITKKIHKCTAA